MSFEGASAFNTENISDRLMQLAGNSPNILEDSGLVFNANVVSDSESINWIKRNLDVEISPPIEYLSSKDVGLIKACTEHADRYNKSKSSDKAILLVHPFYLIVRHLQFINNDSKKKVAKEYLEKLVDLLQRASSVETIEIIILETFYHYPFFTSFYLESGLVNQVVFTQPDNGPPYQENSLDFLQSKQEIYIGGGYNTVGTYPGCLPNAIQVILNRVRSDIVFAVSDLILNSPRSLEDSLKPSSNRIKFGTTGNYFPFYGVVDVERLKKQLCL